MEVASYVGPTTHHRQEVRTFGGKDPIDFYLEDVMLHGTAERVADQIRALAEAGMTYLMAAPLSRRSFNLADRQGAAAHRRYENALAESSGRVQSMLIATLRSLARNAFPLEAPLTRRAMDSPMPGP